MIGPERRLNPARLLAPCQASSRRGPGAVPWAPQCLCGGSGPRDQRWCARPGCDECAAQRGEKTCGFSDVVRGQSAERPPDRFQGIPPCVLAPPRALPTMDVAVVLDTDPPAVVRRVDPPELAGVGVPDREIACWFGEAGTDQQQSRAGLPGDSTPSRASSTAASRARWPRRPAKAATSVRTRARSTPGRQPAGPTRWSIAMTTSSWSSVRASSRSVSHRDESTRPRQDTVAPGTMRWMVTFWPALRRGPCIRQCR